MVWASLKASISVQPKTLSIIPQPKKSGHPYLFKSPTPLPLNYTQAHHRTSQKNSIKMQAALCFPPSTLPLLTPTKPFSPPKNPISKLQTSPFPPLRATSKLQETPSTVDYSSTTSVFPAEACEVVGGEACDAEMYPEVKLKAEAGNPPARSATEGVDREYLEYNSPKTVFPGEACDDLGGEFCEPEYQEGVFQEK